MTTTTLLLSIDSEWHCVLHIHACIYITYTPRIALPYYRDDLRDPLALSFISQISLTLSLSP